MGGNENFQTLVELLQSSRCTPPSSSSFTSFMDINVQGYLDNRFGKLQGAAFCLHAVYTSDLILHVFFQPLYVEIFFYLFPPYPCSIPRASLQQVNFMSLLSGLSPCFRYPDPIGSKTGQKDLGTLTDINTNQVWEEDGREE